MKTLIVPDHLVNEIAQALVDKHNHIPQDEAHDNCILFSFRELYINLKTLGQEHLISAAYRPINKHNRPLFIDR